MATYALLIEYPGNRAVMVGAKGLIEVAAGAYLYVGSAKKGWKKRVGRHLSREKKRRWHIDHLLAPPGVSIREVWLTADNIECTVAAHFVRSITGTNPFAGIGSSDCRCRCHFFRLEKGFSPARQRLGELGLARRPIAEILAASNE